VYDTVGYFGTLFGSILTHNLPVLANEDITSSNAIGKFATTLAAPPARRQLQRFIQRHHSAQQQLQPAVPPRTHSVAEGRSMERRRTQQFGANTTFEIAYVATRRTHLPWRDLRLRSQCSDSAVSPAEIASATSQPAVHSSTSSTPPTTARRQSAAATA